jgi:hypothetical protein
MGRILGPKKEEVSEAWRSLHDVYSSFNIIRFIKIK